MHLGVRVVWGLALWKHNVHTKLRSVMMLCARCLLLQESARDIPQGPSPRSQVHGVQKQAQPMRLQDHKEIQADRKYNGQSELNLTLCFSTFLTVCCDISTDRST